MAERVPLVDVIEEGGTIELRALSIAAGAIPICSLPGEYVALPAGDPAIGKLVDASSANAELEVGIPLYQWIGRIVPEVHVESLFERVRRKNPVEDSLDTMSILNIACGEPITCLADAVLSQQYWFTTDLSELTPHVSFEDDQVYPGRASGYVVPSDMSQSFIRSVEALDSLRLGLVDHKPFRGRITVALRQFAHANDELLDLTSNGYWLADPLVRLMVVLEALLGDRQPEQLSRTLRQRAAILAGPAPSDVELAFANVREAYKLRSAYVHGADKTPDRELLATVRDTVRTILRNWMVCAGAWTDSGGNAGDFLDILDDALLNLATRESVVTIPLATHEAAIGDPFTD
jgi:hypothetical protein